MPDLTYAELGRELGVHASTVSRALKRAAAQPPADGVPPVPRPVNPGHPRPRFALEDVRAWWPHRPGVGQPPADRHAQEMTRSQLAARYGVDRTTLRDALDAAETRWAAGERDLPRPPRPVNPDDSGWPRYRTAQMDAWWAARQTRRRASTDLARARRNATEPPP